jgi:hypothetical protein
VPQTNTYHAETWFESTLRAIKEYVETGFNNSVMVAGQPKGLYNPTTNPGGIYEVVMEFPTAESMLNKVPLPRTIIHFEIDDVMDRWLGIGKNYVRNNYDSILHQWNPQEGRNHRIDWDFGIWTSDRAGGTTQRLRAYQILTNLFCGSIAQAKLDSAVDVDDGRIEIVNFTGGRFITETLNDILTYRSVDGVLEVRVYSRTPLDPNATAPTIETIEQSPDFVIPT